MSSLLRFGCALIAFAPPVSVLITILPNRPHLVILALVGAFFWLFASLLTSMLWKMIELSGSNAWPLVIILSTCIQEGSRFALVASYRYTEAIIKQAISDKHSDLLLLNDIASSLAAGVGFSLMHSLMLYGSVWASSSGTGVLFVDSCPNIPLLFVTALTALGFSLLDVIFMAMAFVAQKKRSLGLAAAIVVLHLIAGLSTLANNNTNGCTVSLPLIYFVVIASGLGLSWVMPYMYRDFYNLVEERRHRENHHIGGVNDTR